MTTIDPYWRDRASCRNADSELFFPVSRGVGRARQIAEAQQFCTYCPVTDQCLRDAARKREGFGIRAGLDLEDPRQRLTAWQAGDASNAAAGVTTENHCGTAYGYRKHIRKGEATCEPCKAANAQREAEAKVRRDAGIPGARTGRPGGRPKKPIEHGTERGHVAHRRRGEKPCTACREAHNQRRQAVRAS